MAELAFVENYKRVRAHLRYGAAAEQAAKVRHRAIVDRIKTEAEHAARQEAEETVTRIVEVHHDAMATGRPAWRKILAEVAEERGLRLSDITGPSRSGPIVSARHEAMWRIRVETKMSLPQIGARFGGRDHTTVLHAVRKHEYLLRRAERLKS